MVRHAVFFQFEGLGFLVPFVAGFCVVVSLIFIKDKRVAYAIGLSGCAVALWYFGRYLRKKDGEEVIDQITGEVIVANPPHSFFWLPIDWWGLIVAGISALLWLDLILRQIGVL